MQAHLQGRLADAGSSIRRCCTWSYELRPGHTRHQAHTVLPSHNSADGNIAQALLHLSYEAVLVQIWLSI